MILLCSIKFNFPIKYKELITVVKAIPSGLTNLMTSHLSYYIVDNKDCNFFYKWQKCI